MFISSLSPAPSLSLCVPQMWSLQEQHTRRVEELQADLKQKETMLSQLQVRGRGGGGMGRRGEKALLGVRGGGACRCT